ncbi:SDR family NAD(P)-dependent oxidoreductase [Pseudonocardia sp. CA-142604]|uniref:SDR family NAD(P)-dependent oxidoreductase n=1 Tax=Pseudonocardia sp. CA-142604 TaxID=3240024 RepID=UPI003D8ED623
MDLGLTDKVVVITGGSSGIGLETARHFASEGARVVIAARREEQLAKAAASIAESTGATVDTLSTDVTNLADLDRLVAHVTTTHGRIDVLVNNAGNGTYKPFLEVTDEELVQGMEINFFAQFRLTQRFAPMMIEQGGGVVVNVTGETAIRVTQPPFRSSCTGPAKAAENRLSKILATELGEHGIRVVAVVPGFVNTEERFARWGEGLGDGLDAQNDRAAAAERRREWGRGIARPGHEWGTPQELADLIVFAASKRATFVNGAVLVADGGDDKS